MPVHSEAIFDPRSLGCRCNTCILGPNGPYYDDHSWRPVPPEVRRSALLFLIGEAPGEKEVEALRPFVGRSGEWLGAVLQQFGVKRTEGSISNAILCRPQHNKLDVVLKRTAAMAKHMKALDGMKSRFEKVLARPVKDDFTAMRALLVGFAYAAEEEARRELKETYRENPIIACNAGGRLLNEIRRGTRIGPLGHRHVTLMGNHSLRFLTGKKNVHISTFRGSPLILKELV